MTRRRARTGRSSSYELYLDGYEIFSKLGMGGFPNASDVIATLKYYAKTGKLPEGAKKVDVEQKKKEADEGCCIM